MRGAQRHLKNILIKYGQLGREQERNQKTLQLSSISEVSRSLFLLSDNIILYSGNNMGLTLQENLHLDMLLGIICPPYSKFTSVLEHCHVYSWFSHDRGYCH